MKRLLATYLPQLAFVAALVLGGTMTFTLYLAEHRRAVAEFERAADLAVDRVITRLRQHIVVLRAAQGLFAASNGAVERDAFVRFLDSVDITHELAGVQGIGFARMIAAGDAAAATREIAGHYGVPVVVWPATGPDWRTPIVLLEPADARNMNALGYDMYSEPVRRAAMDSAIASGAPRISAPVELVQEITDDKQTGVLVYLPFRRAGRVDAAGLPPVDGFVYAPFRGADLIEAALASGPPLPVGLLVSDTGAPGRPLYRGGGNGVAAGLTLRRTVPVLGRAWAFDVHETGAAALRQKHLGSLLVGLTSALFAAAAGFGIAARRDEVARARQVAAAAAREAEFRGLLLQEMKHRIKNHIARIQSIARQSARGATDVRAFTEAFDARLQAMAAVQEILAGNASLQTDIGAILRKELQQCLDTTEVEHLMAGPVVRLDERQAHAFALVTHELVTNAMKYGGLSEGGAGLEITWTVDRPGPDGPPVVAIAWTERLEAGAPAEPAAAGAAGFGSRLIDASVKGELSGSIQRDFGPGGLKVLLRFPVRPDLGQGGGADTGPSRRRSRRS
jgi:CHASE1-domain containing sensor protein/two-component sensor histidine kinase